MARSGITIKVTRVDINSAGAEAVLKSPEVGRELKRRADRIRDAAAPGFARHDVPGTPVIVESNWTVGQSRARASVAAVHPIAMRIEDKYHYLGAALDAGRD